MNDDQIQTFLLVTKAGSFSKAEQNRFISKQSMFKQIEKLEEELSCQLFIRTSKGVTLSESGKIFYDGITQIQADLNALKHKCADPSKSHSIKIGVVEHQVILTPVTELFRKTYPTIEIKQIIHPNHSGEYRIKHHIMDVGETFQSGVLPPTKDFEYTKLTNASYYVAMNETHPLASHTRLSFRDLSSYPTQIYPMMLGKKYTQMMQDAFKDNLTNLIQRTDVDHQVAVAYDLLQNQSLVVGANPFIYNIEGLKVIPLKEKWSREYGIIFQSNPSPIIEKYIQLAKKYYHAK